MKWFQAFCLDFRMSLTHNNSKTLLLYKDSEYFLIAIQGSLEALHKKLISNHKTYLRPLKKNSIRMAILKNGYEIVTEFPPELLKTFKIEEYIAIQQCLRFNKEYLLKYRREVVCDFNLL